MKLEYQVCSLGLAKKLKELGAKKESYFRWFLECAIADCYINWKINNGN